MAVKLSKEELQNKLNLASPEVKEAVQKILDEYKEGEQSSTFNDLLLADYREIPVDIDTFIDDDKYMGQAWKDSDGNSKLYPYWRKQLHKLFPDNLTISVNNFIATGSRGLGKSEICILIMCYILYRCMCLRNVVDYYNLKPSEKLVFAIMNIKLDLAEEVAQDKFQKSIQLSPWFMERGTVTGTKYKIWQPNDEYHIDIKIGSQSSDVLGLPVFFCFCDEISFIRNQNIDRQKEIAVNIIDTAIGGMKTRFIHNGKNPTLLCLASSKRSEQSFLESYVKKKLASEHENVLIIDQPVWVVKPKGTYSDETFPVAVGNKFLTSRVLSDDYDDKTLESLKNDGYNIIYPPVDLKADFIDDIERALCDFAGISSTELSKYISGEALNECINPNRQNPFVKDVIEVGLDDDLQYSDFFDMNKVDKKMMNKPLFIHLDMSTGGDKTGIAGVWIVGKNPSSTVEQDKDLYFELAFSVSIKAPKGHQIAFNKHRIFINWLKEQGFKIKKITADQFQSSDIRQELSRQGYDTEMLSVDRTEPNSRICLPYQYFKSTLYENRIDLYRSQQLTQEVVNLERNINSGKIDHPVGGCVTGDTKISLCDGRELSILELIDEFNQNKQNYVYSVNSETLNIEPDLIVNAFKTKTNAKLIEVILDNGEKIKCTPDHRFMLRDGSYCEAQHLMVGTSLMPLYRKYATKGLIGYRMFYNTGDNKWHYEHREFCKQVDDEKYLVHHINCNPKDNSPINLIWVSRKKHHQIHDELQIGAQSVEAREKRKRSVKAYADDHPESYVERGKKASITLLSKPENIERHKKEQERIDEIEKIFNIKWDELSASEKNSYGGKYTRLKHPEIQEQISVQLSKSHAEGKFDNAKKALAECNKQSHEKALQRYYESEEYQTILAINEMFGINYASLPANQKISYRHRYTNTMKRTIKNHKVVEVRFIDETQDVYDITTEHNHNFALTAGVFIHNSKDVSDAVCFTGDTKVFLCDRSITFKELLDEFNNGVENHILSVNRENHKIQVDKIVSVCLTKQNAEIIQVELDNGEKIKCTSDHRFMLKDEYYCEAQNLEVGQELKSLTIEGNKIVSRNNTYKVVSITKLNEREDVYDLTTELNHNFLLTSGVFVHNCGALYTAAQNAEEYGYKYGESMKATDITTMLDVGLKDDQEATQRRLMTEFEEDLKNLNPGMRGNYGPNGLISNDDPKATILDGDVLIW